MPNGVEHGRAWTLTTAEYDRLVSAGILGPVEMMSGRVLMNGRYDLVFSPEQVEAARSLGVEVRSCVGAVMDDPALRAEVKARFAREAVSQDASAAADPANVAEAGAVIAAREPQGASAEGPSATNATARAPTPAGEYAHLRASAAALLDTAHGYVQRALTASGRKHPADVVMPVAVLVQAWLVSQGFDEPRQMQRPVATLRKQMAPPSSTTVPTSPRTDVMSTEPPAFDDRARDRDWERLRVATEHYVDVVRCIVRGRLADGEHPVQAMLEGVVLMDSWMAAAGEPGYESPRVLVSQLDELLDTLAGKLDPSAQLRWLRTVTDVLDGVAPIEAIVRHRIRSVLAVARSLPDPPPAGSTPVPDEESRD